MSMSPAKTASSLPSAPGMMVKVLEMPSWESMKGSLATEEREATAPSVSYTHLDVYKRQDVTRVRKLFREDAAEYKAKADAVRQAEIYRNYYRCV